MIIEVPPSKSISNRALVLSFLSPSSHILKNVLKSDDTRVMLQALFLLGVELEILREDERAFDVKVHGTDNGMNLNCPVETEVYLQNAGTAMRFMTAVLSQCPGNFVLTGNQRMHKRPISDLVKALKQVGAKIVYLDNDGYPPLQILGSKLEGKVKIKGNVSSQYISALKIMNAFRKNPLDIEISGDLVSKPYVDLTDSVIADFKSSEEYEIEGDASSASYFWARGALLDKPVQVSNVSAITKQADIQFLQALRDMGVNVSVDLTVSRNELKGLGEYDCKEFPDSAMTLTVLAAVADGKTRLTGLSNLKFKECDRLQALESELNKLGCKVKAFADGLEIEGIPRDSLKPAKIETYDDHRMAMCFAVLKLLQPEIEILDPGCVSKTYPTFWEDFQI